MRPPLSSGRHGVGALLVVILSMIVVLSIIGIGQRFLGSAVSNQTQRASIGDLCLELAESAIEELAHQFRTKVNDKRSPIFSIMRKDVYGTSLGNKDLTPYVETPQMAKILQEPAYSKFYLRDVRAEIVYQHQFESLPYERFSLLRLRAQVRFDLSLTESVAREVEVGLGVKVHLAGPARPFDQGGFMLLVPGTAPADMEFAELEQKKRDYLALVNEVHEDAKKYADHPQTPGLLKDEYREVLTLVHPKEYWAPPRLKDLPTENFIFFAGKEPPQVLDVQELFIFKKLEEKEKNELTPAVREVERALRRVTTAPEDIGAHRDLIAAFRRRAKALAAQLNMMEEHGRLFDPKTGDMFKAVMDHAYKLTADHWARKPFFAIEEKPGKTADAQLQEWLASHKKPDGTVGPINGVVRILNAGPVNLAGVDIRGKLTFVTDKGGVRLSKLNRGERPQDLLTVLSVGGPITVEGDVHAQVLGDNRASFSPSPGATIHGGLALATVPTRSSREFKLVRDPKYNTGTTTQHSAANAYADYYYVAASPRFVYRKVRR